MCEIPAKDTQGPAGKTRYGVSVPSGRDFRARLFLARSRLPPVQVALLQGRVLAREDREKQGEGHQTETALADAGWRILTVWECAFKGRTRKPESEILAAAAWWLRSGSGSMVLEGSA